MQLQRSDHNRFRPLSGHLISKFLAIVKSDNIEASLVSVPSRGILFPNKREIQLKINREVFPSPLGASYFQMKATVYSIEKDEIVSVPSRGILFPNMIRLKLHGIWAECFRPLSGHLISKFLSKSIFPKKS